MRLSARITLFLSASLSVVGCATRGVATSGGNSEVGVTVPALPPAGVLPVAPMLTAPESLVLPSTVQDDLLRLRLVARVERDSLGVSESADIKSEMLVSMTQRWNFTNSSGTGEVQSYAVSVSSPTQRMLSANAQGSAQTSASSDSGTMTVSRDSIAGFPFDFTVDSTQVRVSVRPALDNECDRMESAATSAVRDILVRVPRDISKSSRWSDNTTSFVCRAGVPIAIKVQSNYIVENIEVKNNRIEVVIARTTETNIDGASTISWRRRTVTGTGTGSQTIRINGATGSLIELSGVGTLVLRVGAERVTQRVEQFVSRSLDAGAGAGN